MVRAIISAILLASASHAQAMDLSPISRKDLLSHGYTQADIDLFDIVRVAPAQVVFDQYFSCLKRYSETSNSVIVANEKGCVEPRIHAVAVISRQAGLAAADKLIAMTVDILKIPQDEEKRHLPSPVKWVVGPTTKGCVAAMSSDRSDEHSLTLLNPTGVDVALFKFAKTPPSRPLPASINAPKEAIGFQATFRRQGMSEGKVVLPFLPYQGSYALVIAKGFEGIFDYASVEFENGEFFVLGGEPEVIKELNDCRAKQ